MNVNDIALVKESSTWSDGCMRGKTVIIDKVSGDSYSISSIDGLGGGAWISGCELDFVRHATREDIDGYTLRHNNVTKNQKDLFWIKDHWSELKQGISANTVLALLHAIGYSSSFEKNGEYFILHEDYSAFYPVFDAIMSGEYDATISALQKVIKSEFIEKYILSVTLLYKKLNASEAI